jgi:hypothetical protein
MQMRRAWVAVALLFTGLILLFAYPLAPDYLRQAICPRGTFLSGPIGEEISVLGVILVTPSFFILALATLKPDFQPEHPATNWILRHRLLLSASASCALVIAAALWVNFTFRFYCVTPSAILLHPNPLGQWQNFSWDDVRTVQATCWAGSRTPWQGGQSLILSDGETILLPFGSGRGIHGHEALKHNYDAIKNALWGKKYQYDTSKIGRCAANVRRLLMRWPEEVR